jgi:hypothetical protein
MKIRVILTLPQPDLDQWSQYERWKATRRWMMCDWGNKCGDLA